MPKTIPAKDAADFVKLLKQLDEKQQTGLYLMIQGAALLAQKKVVRKNPDNY